MKSLLFPAVMSAAILVLPAEVRTQCANSANIYHFVYGGKSYEVVREKRTWVQAAACAHERGGVLAEINSAAEQTALFTQLISNAGITPSNTTAPDGGGAAYVWIGGNDMAVEGRWIWDGANTGSGVQFWQGLSAANGGYAVGGQYTNWGNEPDNYGPSGQDALGLALTNWPYGSAGQWNDINENNQIYYIIEHPAIIPVELGSFGARYEEGIVKLQWTTVAESNNAGWVVERCEPLRDWTGIGFVDGAGTSNREMRYTFVDSDPPAAGYIGYRLQQVDLDGTISYSPTTGVVVPARQAALELLPPYPNPARDDLHVPFTTAGDADISVRMMNAAGLEQPVLRHDGRFGPGIHVLHAHVSRLPGVMYFIECRSGSQVSRIPVAVMR
ncbi:MAG: lectin-like protein [Bacteroidota bacterium]|nr:lectin-like protein [Bacteroidota bacterium]